MLICHICDKTISNKQPIKHYGHCMSCKKFIKSLYNKKNKGIHDPSLP